MKSCSPFTAENQYEPPRYWLFGARSDEDIHPSGVGMYKRVQHGNQRE